MLILTLFACREPIEAPTDLYDLSAYLFAEWDAEDPAVLAAGVENIELMAADYPVDSDDWDDRGFDGVDGLTADTVSDLTLGHGHDPADATGVAMFLLSSHDVDAHVGLFLLEDQTPIEPASPNHYERSITEGGDCFPGQDCDTLASTNDLSRENILIDADQVTDKVWRWVELSDGRMAVSGRTWQAELPDSDKEDIIYQGYSVEVWIPQDAGTLRFLTTWSETSFDVGDTLILSSVNDSFIACDDYLDAN